MTTQSEPKFPLTKNQRRVLGKCADDRCLLPGESIRTLESLCNLGFLDFDTDRPGMWWRRTADGRAEALKQ
jgi:hypothetical protein